MLKDFLNLRSLDRFRRIGRWAQFIGFALIVGPPLSVLMKRAGGFGPNPILDPLPNYSPSALADRHPEWVAAVTVPIGIIVLVVGTRFLGRRIWARTAMQRVCWFGAVLSIAQGVLSVSSAFGLSDRFFLFFAAGSLALGVFFAVVLVHTARTLDTPELRAEFEADGGSQ